MAGCVLSKEATEIGSAQLAEELGQRENIQGLVGTADDAATASVDEIKVVGSAEVCWMSWLMRGRRMRPERLVRML